MFESPWKTAIPAPRFSFMSHDLSTSYAYILQGKLNHIMAMTTSLIPNQKKNRGINQSTEINNFFGVQVVYKNTLTEAPAPPLQKLLLSAHCQVPHLPLLLLLPP